MLNVRTPVLRNQALIGISLFVLGLWLAKEVGGEIVAGDLHSITLGGIALAACAVAATILRDWRRGFYLFMLWLLFEDLARKYLGNGTALFFGKDVLVALVYVSFFAALRRRRERAFHPAFLLPLVLFAWLAGIQVFNPNSPNVLYGLLGFKLYFFYVPLMYVGYAFVKKEEDLRKFLVANGVLAGVISLLGIIQAIIGNSFLNPKQLAPELQELGDLYKVSPLSGQVLSLPDSVFVSAGRFGLYLILVTILMIGAIGYFVLTTERGRKFILIVIAIIGGAVLLNGSRGAVMYSMTSALVLGTAFLWGAPWRQRQVHRSLRAVRRSLLMAALGLAAVILVFPDEAGPRIAFYAETLLPSSSAYEVNNRTWNYPINNLISAFDQPNWMFGNGTGTASLGVQYVSKLIGQRPPQVGVEEGYGQLILEMGVIAPFMWILWTAALLYCSWKVVKQLRGTRLFPIAFAIFWYAFLLLYPFTYTGLPPYQNYVTNAYLWLLVGVLFGLPNLLPTTPAVVPPPKPELQSGLQV